VSGLSIEEEKRLLFGRGRWIWQANGASPIRDPVDRRGDKVDQISLDSGLAGGILFRNSFFFCVKIVFAIIG